MNENKNQSPKENPSYIKDKCKRCDMYWPHCECQLNHGLPSDCPDIECTDCGWLGKEFELQHQETNPRGPVCQATQSKLIDI